MDIVHQAGNPSVAEVRPCTIPLVAVVGYVELVSVYRMAADSVEVVENKSCSLGSKPPTSAMVWPFHFDVELPLGAVDEFGEPPAGAGVIPPLDGAAEPPPFLVSPIFNRA